MVTHIKSDKDFYFWFQCCTFPVYEFSNPILIYLCRTFWERPDVEHLAAVCHLLVLKIDDKYEKCGFMMGYFKKHLSRMMVDHIKKHVSPRVRVATSFRTTKKKKDTAMIELKWLRMQIVEEWRAYNEQKGWIRPVKIGHETCRQRFETTLSLKDVCEECFVVFKANKDI
jgi:hypothetical protein